VLRVILILLGIALIQRPDLTIAPAFVAQGNFALRTGDVSTAIEAYTAALNIHPGDLSIIERLYRAAVTGSRPDMALGYLRLLAQTEGWTPELYRRAASILEARGDEPGAVAYWAASLEGKTLDISDIPVLHKIAAWRLAGREWDAVISAFEQILTLAPDDPETVYRLGLMLAPSNPRRSVAYLERATSDYPRARTITEIFKTYGNEPPALVTFRIGLALINAREWPYAEHALAVSVAVDARPAALAFLGLAQDQQGRDGWPLLSRAVESAPNDPLANYAVGVHWRLKGDFQQALTALTQARALDSNNPGIAAEIGLVYQNSGYLAEAEIWLNRAVALAPDDLGFRALLANFYADENFDLSGQGLKYIQAAVERAPNNADIRASLGWAMLTNGEYDKARDELQQALTLDPGNPRARFYFAVYLEYRGDVDGAIDSYLFVYRADQSGFRERAARALQRLGYQPGAFPNELPGQ
jgi:tetratricopeptide (TPR) repeat protein